MALLCNFVVPLTYSWTRNLYMTPLSKEATHISDVSERSTLLGFPRGVVSTLASFLKGPSYENIRSFCLSEICTISQPPDSLSYKEQVIMPSHLYNHTHNTHTHTKSFNYFKLFNHFLTISDTLAGQV